MTFFRSAGFPSFNAATLLRSPDPSQEFSQMHLKARIVELTVENAIHLFSDPFKGAS